MKNQNVLNSPRLLELKRKQRKILRRKIFFLVFLLILVLVGLSFLSKWEKVNINNIQISGNKVVETKMIEDIAKEKIAGNFLWVLPKTNFLLYPKGEIKKELADKFKRLKDISISIKNLQTLDISLTERTALYTYCGTMPPELNNSEIEIQNNNKCYFMDDSGYIFDEAPYFSGEVYLKFYGTASFGSYFSQPIFGKLILLKETLEKIAIKPVIFYVQDNGDIEMFLSSTSESQLGPKIILKTDSDFEKVAENLQTVLGTEPFKSDFKNKYSSLLYIDLRFGNKVYYKFK
ncbi:MAG: hypothetical protein WC447_00800 [Candidatus Paceibacterota bacterium]|jgi:hypothetical protein